MTPLDYDYLRKLLKERSGLVLSADKQYLVESRLTPLVRKTGLASLADLVAKLKCRDERLLVDVIEAMTTNESFFYRDKIPFDHFREAILPGLIAARAREKRIRIWCAAASTGQEPYSLAMCVKEMKERLGSWRVEILATDLSMEVLEKAKAGVYSQFEVQRGLPIQMLVKYFAQVGDTWQIAPDVRAIAVTFVALHEARETADYDDAATVQHTEALAAVQQVEDAFRSWLTVQTDPSAVTFLQELLYRSIKR